MRINNSQTVLLTVDDSSTRTRNTKNKITTKKNHEKLFDHPKWIQTTSPKRSSRQLLQPDMHQLKLKQKSKAASTERPSDSKL